MLNDQMMMRTTLMYGLLKTKKITYKSQKCKCLCVVSGAELGGNAEEPGVLATSGS